MLVLGEVVIKPITSPLFEVIMRTLGQYIRYTRLVSNHTLFTASKALRIDKSRLENIEADKEYPTQTILKQMIQTFKMDETYVKIILKRIMLNERKRDGKVK